MRGPKETGEDQEDYDVSCGTFVSLGMFYFFIIVLIILSCK